MDLGESIYVATVANSNRKDGEGAVGDLGKDAVVADAVAPYAGVFGGKAFAPLPRIIKSFNFFEVSHYTALDRPLKPLVRTIEL